MTQPSPQERRTPARRPRLNLPFDNRRQDAGTWAYEHRVGLCVTLIAYLVLMIVFVSSKIVVGRRASTQGMYIDVETLTELEQERDRLEEEVRRRQEQQQSVDWRSIRNRVSNENALLDERLRDDRGTNVAEINEAAAEAAERMQANREAYELGLAEEQAILARRGRKEGDQVQDTKAKGRVTVSFSLVNPVRTSRRLDMPVYLCEGGRRGDRVDHGGPRRPGHRGESRRGGRRLHARNGAAGRPQLALQHRSDGPCPSAGHHHLHFHPAVVGIFPVGVRSCSVSIPDRGAVCGCRFSG